MPGDAFYCPKTPGVMRLWRTRAAPHFDLTKENTLGEAAAEGVLIVSTVGSARGTRTALASGVCVRIRVVSPETLLVTHRTWAFALTDLEVGLAP